MVPQLIAFYLPQYHPIPENDQWWGPGFTEWTNVAKARPRFRHHYQPHIPRDLGFYDLRLPQTRVAQAEMARTFGITAFCYYHYWFAGRRILERPFNEVLSSGTPDFPFCLCWANESWTGVWHGAPNRVLIEQTYPGAVDDARHFDSLLDAFRDPRYLKIEGKPLFMIYRPWMYAGIKEFIELWRKRAEKAGLPGMFFVTYTAPTEPHHFSVGFDACMVSKMPKIRAEIWVSRKNVLRSLQRWVKDVRGIPNVYSYNKLCLELLGERVDGMESYPCLIPNWDNSPRSGKNGLVLHGSNPLLFRKQVYKALEMTWELPASRRLIFVKSWNEWAEGNHLEPDIKFGVQYLQVIRDALSGEQ